jgi:hypothetical protein
MRMTLGHSGMKMFDRMPATMSLHTSSSAASAISTRNVVGNKHAQVLTRLHFL